MTVEQRKKQLTSTLVQKLDTLSEKELNYLLTFIEELQSSEKDKKHIPNDTFEALLKEDLEKYKNVWKKLA